MEYETNRPSASSGGLIVALVLLLLLGGLVVVGLGTYFWLRTESVARQAALAERAAMEAQLQAAGREALSQQQQQEQAAEAAGGGGSELPAADIVDVFAGEIPKADATITVDQDGSIAVHGQPVTHNELASVLKNLAGQHGSALTLTVWADEGCAFRDIAAVVRKVREAGVGAIQLVVPPRGDDASDSERN